MARVRQDLRHALRVLGKSPVLTAALVVSLGIGTGANAAVANFISALFLRPPAGIDEPSTLAIVRAVRSSAGDAGLASHADLEALRASGAFDAISAYDDSLITGATIDGTTRRARVAAVTGDLFATLGMSASLGRTLTPSDTRAAMISHGLWRASGAPADLAGKTVTIDGVPFSIVGVAPEGFHGFHTGRRIDVLRLHGEPLTPAGRTTRSLNVLARTGDRDGAEARLGGRFAVLRYSFLGPDRTSETALLAAILTGATFLVLVCALVNAAGLLLSRGNARRADLAVKLALGARRSALVRQLLVESAIVGIAGGCAGLLFAQWTTTIVPSLFAPEHAEMLDAGLSAGLVIATLGGSTLLGIGIGLMPAIYGTASVTSLDLRGDAGSISSSARGSRLQRGLLVAQIALSTVLLVSALLLNRSLGDALEGDLGDDARNIAVATLSEPPMSFKPLQGQQGFAEIAKRTRETRGVAHAGLTAVLPLGAANRGVFTIETAPGVHSQVEADTNVVSLTYFETMGTPLVEGRVFTDADSGLAPAVAIVNDEAARRFFGGSAIGRHLIDARGDAIEIVGVIASGRYRTLQAEPAPMVYRPVAQEYLPRMYLVIRAGAPPSPEMFRRLRPAMMAPGIELRRMATLEEHFAEALVLDRFVTTLVTACGLMAVLLAIAGAYSLMLDSVSRRTREIGLRMALGASAVRIARSIFGYGLGLCGIGLVTGLALMLIVERVVRMFVYGLPAVGIVSMLTASGVLLMVVSLAAILPARYALRVSPTIALRHS